MSHIDDLIVDLCPEGVRYVELGDILSYEQPTQYLVASKNYDDSYATPVLTAGQTFLLGRTDEIHGIYPADANSPVIIFDDFTTAFKWVDFPFKAKSSAMKMLSLKDNSLAVLRYVYFAMQAIQYFPQDHARQWIGTYSKLKIPIPPIVLQNEIVSILDNFVEIETKLRSELNSEYHKRLTQYQYLRNQILNSAEGNGCAYKTYKLRDLVHFTNAKAHEKFVDPNGDIALITSRFVSTQGVKARYINSADVLTPARIDDVALVMSDLPNGKALARAFYVDKNDAYAANQRVCLLRVRNPEVISSRFLYYSVDRNPQLLKFDNGLDQTHLKKDWILDIKIQVPSLECQLHISTLLESLGNQTSRLLAQIPTEISARRQQFEYYRDKLLTFKEAA